MYNFTVSDPVGRFFLRSLFTELLVRFGTKELEMIKQSEKKCLALTHIPACIGTLFYLTTVASHFLSNRLTYKTSMHNELHVDWYDMI